MAEGQLLMRRVNLEGLPEVEAPEGYSFRTYRPGDEAHWCHIMEGSIGEGWTVERCREFLVDKPWFDPEGLFFATWEGTPIGSACARTDTLEERKIGVVHMVAVLKEHRGRRLGYWLTLLTLHHLREKRLGEAYLATDDWRLSAIRAYLDLGFEPVLLDDSLRRRWEAVGERLGAHFPGGQVPRCCATASLRDHSEAMSDGDVPKRKGSGRNIAAGAG